MPSPRRDQVKGREASKINLIFIHLLSVAMQMTRNAFCNCSLTTVDNNLSSNTLVVMHKLFGYVQRVKLVTTTSTVPPPLKESRKYLVITTKQEMH